MLVESLKVLLTADSSKMAQEFQKAEARVNKLGEKFERVSMAAGLAGAAITGAGVLMVREAMKFDRGVKGAVDGVQNAFSTLSVEIARALLPAIQQLERGVTALVLAWRSLDPETQKLIVNITAATAGVLAFVAAGSKMTGVFLKLLPIILPILPVVLGIAAALIALIAVTGWLRTAWDKNFGGIQEKAKEALDFLVDGWNKFSKTVKDILRPLGDAIVRMILNPVELVLSALQKVLSKIPGVPAAITGGLDAAVATVRDMAERGIGGVIDDATSGFKIMWTAVEEMGKDALDGTKKNVRDLKKLLLDLANQMGIVIPDIKLPKLAPLGNPVEKAAKKMDAAAGKLESAAASLAGFAVSKLDGGIGKTVQAGIQGAQAGGAYGAIAAVLIELLSQTAEFAKMVETMNVGLGDLVGALGAAVGPLLQAVGALVRVLLQSLTPIFSALQPTMEQLAGVLYAIAPLFDLVGALLTAIAPVLQIFLGTLTPVFEALKIVVDAIVTVVRPIVLFVLMLTRGIIDVWNAIINALADALNTVLAVITLGVVQNGGEWLRAMTASTANITKAMEDISLDMLGMASGTMSDGLNTVTVAANDTADSLNRLNEALTNVPAGFKVAAAQYNAQLAQGTASYGGSLNEPVVVQVYVDSTEVAARVERRGRMGKFRKTGGFG